MIKLTGGSPKIICHPAVTGIRREYAAPTTSHRPRLARIGTRFWWDPWPFEQAHDRLSGTRQDAAMFGADALPDVPSAWDRLAMPGALAAPVVRRARPLVSEARASRGRAGNS